MKKSIEYKHLNSQDFFTYDLKIIQKKSLPKYLLIFKIDKIIHEEGYFEFEKSSYLE